MIDNPTFRELRNWHDISLTELDKKSLHELFDWIEANLEGRHIVGYAYASLENEADVEKLKEYLVFLELGR